MQGNSLPGSEDEEAIEPVPWHFKLLLVAFVLYLLWRGSQLVMWGWERYL